MINKKEMLALVFALIILAFSDSFKQILGGNSIAFVNSLMIFAIIMIIYVAAKKITAYYYESKEESKLWTFQRYGLYTRSYFKTPIPVGIILPFLLSVLSLGYIKWFAVTESDVNPTPARAVRRHDFYSFSEMTEYHLALISAAGIFFVLLIAPLAYVINVPELAKASIFFACFNMLPLGKLDGTRIFFGSVTLWLVLAIVCIIGLTYAILL